VGAEVSAGTESGLQLQVMEEVGKVRRLTRRLRLSAQTQLGHPNPNPANRQQSARQAPWQFRGLQNDRLRYAGI